MSYKPNESDLMAYLYGELEGAEKEAMDKYLFEHPEARESLGREGAKKIETDFHVKHRIKAIEGIYQDLLAERAVKTTPGHP